MRNISVVLFANGVFDIACGCTVLFQCVRPLSTLHKNVIEDKQPEKLTSLGRKILAYWLLTYGGVRLLAGVSSHKTANTLASWTYFIESLYYIQKATEDNCLNAASVAAASALLCVLTFPSF